MLSAFHVTQLRAFENLENLLFTIIRYEMENNVPIYRRPTFTHGHISAGGYGLNSPEMLGKMLPRHVF